MDHEQEVQPECRQPLHDLATGKDDDIVGHEERGRLLERGQGRAAFDKLKLTGWISHHFFKDLVKDGP